MKTPTFMLVPSLACQASCKYCFGPHKGAVMDERTAREAVRFIASIASETTATSVSIIFHGGEPLLAPLPVWEAIFEEVQDKLAGLQVKMDLQSNLWNLTDELLQLFMENGVSIGTSLDGPKALCDLNRGEGYFNKTWASVQKAKASGASVGAIATLTRQTYLQAEDIARFYRNNSMPLVMHGAVAEIGDGSSPYALTPMEYADAVISLFPWYIENRKHCKIDTLDQFCRGVVNGEPEVCTLKDCSGMFLSISPTGDITSCQRLAGREQYSMGNIFDKPTLAQLNESKAARALRAREALVKERCAECDIYQVCKGGCYYNAIATGDGVIDPMCEGYKKIYGFVTKQVFEEMASPENIQDIADRPVALHEHPLLRKGLYISLAQKTHPAHVSDNARHLLAAYELGKTNDTRVAAENLYSQKICGDVAVTESLLAKMQAQLHNSEKRLNNCYLHVTFNCNLRCGHCYASAGTESREMPAEGFAKLMDEATAAGFRKVIITGGEPMVHSGFDELVRKCKARRGKGAILVLRTNLTGNFTEEDYVALASSFNQVVVSVDGNAETHDTRRGTGTYDILLRNLEEYVRVAGGMPNAAELSLACVMPAADINGEPGWSVSALAQRLDISRVRFRPVLPIGRAAHMEEPVVSEGLMAHKKPADVLKLPFQPMNSCGIGQNLYIRPDGNAYPCYAWCGDHAYLGNVLDAGIANVLESESFAKLVGCTVDTMHKCRDCDYRYLCGGACRAWGNQSVEDVNAAPGHCGHLMERAEKLVQAAIQYIRT